MKVESCLLATHYLIDVPSNSDFINLNIEFDVRSPGKPQKHYVFVHIIKLGGPQDQGPGIPMKNISFPT